MPHISSSKDRMNVNPTTLFDDMPISVTQKIVFAICFVLNMFDGMDVVIVSYSASGIMADLGLRYGQMGLVFSAGLIGMALGGLVLGFYADKIGRRKLILGGLALIATGVFLGGQSQNIQQLGATRILAGIGIGGLLASVTAMTAEYAPKRARNTIVMLITAGYPLGALTTGLVVAIVMPTFGWRLTMAAAGVLTAAMIPLCLLLLPESLSFLAGKDKALAVKKINTILGKMHHPLIGSIASAFYQTHTGINVTDLLKSRFRIISIGLWGGLFFTFMTMYYLLSWIPKIAIDSGLSSDKAIIAGAVFSGGGFLGVWAVGAFANRYGYIRSIIGYCVIAFMTMIVYSVYRGELILVLLIAMIMGFTVQGAVGAFYGAAAKVYPAHMKSTGIGWTIGVGRMGAIAGPFLGGYLLAMDLKLVVNFAIFGAIMLIAAIIIYPLRYYVDEDMFGHAATTKPDNPD
ncbi:MAG: MFS transporter [Robiginitomaculum sp.]|nr:MAG: MFS transporter [Robiginitomaculum sp.]